ACSIGAFHSLTTTKESYREVDHSAVGVSSALITAFDSLIQTENTPQEFHDGNTIQEALNQILIALPSDLRFEENTTFAASISTNGECRRARSAYLKAVHAFVEGRLSRQ